MAVDLPGAVRSEQGEGFSPGDLEVEMVERHYRPVAVDHAREPQCGAVRSAVGTCRAAARFHDLNVIGAPAPSIECSVTSETATLGARSFRRWSGQRGSLRPVCVVAPARTV